jgi:glycosyltransferase involved in cell wall biosynthesis
MSGTRLLDPQPAPTFDTNGRPRVSVVVETDNERTAQEIKLRHALQALATQTYPPALTEVIVVDSGEIPELPRLVAEHRPGTRIVNGAGLSEYQMKNLGVREATGGLVAFTDGDCTPSPNWIEQIVKSFLAESPSVVGVQGRTVLRTGLFSRQISVLLYGLRTDATGRVCRRLIADNCAFRRDFLRQVPFDPAGLPTTPETVLWTRMTHRGFWMVVNDEMRSTHDYPVTEGLGGWITMLRFFLQRAYSNGYCMTRVRSLVSGLRATWIRWLGPAGPPVLVAGKMVADLDQIARNSRALGLTWLDWIPFLPLYAAYYVAHLVGGYAALLRLPAPRA